MKRPSLWKRALARAIPAAFRKVDAQLLEELEEALVEADFGVEPALRFVARVEAEAKRNKALGAAGVRRTLADGVRRVLLDRVETDLVRGLRRPASGPAVVLMAGVNGVGKTTTTGKLAHRLGEEGDRVMVAAADTFRAGAVEQLARWAERAGADFVGGRAGGDPAAVAFDAVDAALARGVDVLLVDTAGRLHTHAGLMREIEKVERVVGKRLPGAPHDTLLTLDATVGQNGLVQAREFSKRVRVTGIVLAKLDSTARGGIVVALTDELGIPVRFVGVGEAKEDLEPFDVDDFVRGLLETP